MPFTVQQLAIGANATIETYKRNAPVDQINSDRPTLAKLISGKKDVTFGNGSYNETIYISNSGNYQNYFGADQVTYNERDPVRLAKFAYANAHDGFWFDEDRLAANGIIITDDGSAKPTAEESQQLINLIDTSYMAMRNSFQEGLNLELLQSGSGNSKAVVGLDAIVSTTPTTGTVGGIDASTSTYWRNNISLAVSSANLINEMESQWRACQLRGGETPDYITCGAAFLDAYRVACSGLGGAGAIQRTIVMPEKGGIGLDASTSGLFFKGIPLVWDPSFEALDVLLGAITYPWTKRCYFLNTRHIGLKAVKGAWMVNRKPERLPDRYVHYFGMTSKQALTTNKRNCHSVMSIA